MKPWDQRNGVWVETDLGVGIRLLNTIQVPGIPQGVVTAAVHLVDSDGITIAEVPQYALKEVRLARISSIPPGRIQGLSADDLAARGYLNE